MMPRLELVRAKAQIVESMEEYYDSIRTNVQSSRHDLKIITLTSAQSGEGRSTTSANLAISFARVDFRILLVDADACNSVMSGTFKSNEHYQGLTSFLSGSTKLPDAVCDTSIDNLTAIPTGQVPPNSTPLIQNDSFKATTEAVRGLHDYAITDAPPLSLAIDTAILAHHPDAGSLVIKTGEDRRRIVTKLRKQLEQSDSAFLDVILNKYDIYLDKHGSYDSYDGYGSCDDYGRSEKKTKISRDK